MVPISRSSAAWTLKPADFINAFEAGHEHEAKAVLMLGPGADSLSPQALRNLASAVLHASIDLAMPHYSIPPNTGFINSAILYPLTQDAVCRAGAFSAGARYVPLDAYGGANGHGRPALQRPRAERGAVVAGE